MNLQSTINNYLLENGIKKNHIAERTGITTNALSLALNGKRKLLADEYIRICDALEVPYDYFVDTLKTIPA